MKHRTEFRLRRSVAAVLGAVAFGVVVPLGAITPGVASAEPGTDVVPPTTSKQKPYPYYVNCQQVWRERNGPLLAGQPGYAWRLDSDRNGIACD